MNQTPFRIVGLFGLTAFGFSGLLGCEKSGDFLLPAAIEGVPGIVHIEAEDGGPHEVGFVADRAGQQASTIYTEIGPTGDVYQSGITMEFLGTGGTVCAFVDPEMVAWNQSISETGDRRWRQPDNVFDDGDADMQVGLSLYYTGEFNERMGGFEVQYSDGLGNDVEVELVSCRNFSTLNGEPDAHSGKGTAEFCAIENTQPGVAYTLAFEGFSLPIDDLRMGIGILLSQGPCVGGPDEDGDGFADGLINRISPPNSQDPILVNYECVIMGEGIKPKEGGTEVWYGYEEGRTWAGSEELEATFCDVEGPSMREYCNAERQAKEDAGVTCSRNSTGPDTPDEERCYCGDNRDSPTPGAAEF